MKAGRAHFCRRPLTPKADDVALLPTSADTKAPWDLLIFTVKIQCHASPTENEDMVKVLFSSIERTRERVGLVQPGVGRAGMVHLSGQTL